MLSGVYAGVIAKTSLLLTHRWVFQSIQLLWRVSRKGRQNHSWQYFADGNWRIAVESSNPPMLTEDLAVILNWLGFAWPKHRIQQVLSQVEMPCKTQRFWKHHCIYQIYRIISYIWINIYIYTQTGTFADPTVRCFKAFFDLCTFVRFFFGVSRRFFFLHLRIKPIQGLHYMFGHV